MNKQSVVWRVLGKIWRGLDRVRRAVHLVFMLFVLLVLVAMLAPDHQPIPASAALILAPQGYLVDQLSGDPLERAVARAQGVALQETLLKDLVEALRAAHGDRRIGAVVLQLDGLAGAGLSKLQELADEIVEFQTSGKPVIALGSAFTQAQYYVAAYADEIYMHPMGSVVLDGYSRYVPYYKSALEKLYIDYEVWTVGEFKSFVEPITRDAMSPEDREASEVYLQALWDAYQVDITSVRELPADSLQRFADDAVELLRAAGGDTAALAVDSGLVDELKTRDQMRTRIREIVGGGDPLDSEFTGIEHVTYLVARRAVDLTPERASKIAVIVAAGTILDGMQPPGTVGGDSTAQLVRQAARDERVKALVLRVDSPGGSAFASDLIARELEVFQATGRPVVVSMGSVAASGGYWIAMIADEIWAHPTTLTGSIGVGATVPTFPRTLERLGINVDGLGTTALAGAFDVTRGIGDDARELIGQSIRHTYAQFIGRVAQHRGREITEIDSIARGRVWVGRQAFENGLVDALGDMDDAIVSAAELAGLAEDSYNVEYVEPQLSIAERLMLDLFSAAAPAIATLGVQPRIPHALERLLEAAAHPLSFLELFNDPRGIYAYCFCDVR
jgi:protease-4